MKKAIIAILIVAVIAVGGWFVYDKVIMSPERLIVGTWQSDESEYLYYQFNDDGTMQGRIKLSGFTKTIDGTYKIDKDEMTVSISYDFELITVDPKYEFEIDGDTLTFTEDDTETTYTRIKTDKVKEFIDDVAARSTEKKLVGTWQNDENDYLYYTFNDDGTMNGSVKLSGFGDIGISGTYSVNEKNSTITITYTVLGLSYDDIKVFTLDGDELTLQTQDTNLVNSFTRVDPDEIKTESTSK